MVGTVLLVFAWTLRISMKHDIFLELVIVIFYVILPHTFLMNSSHNKERIIEEGLKNIIRNALDMPFDLKKIFTIFRKSCNEEGLESEQSNQVITEEDRKTTDEVVETKNCASGKDIPMVYIISERNSSSIRMQNERFLDVKENNKDKDQSPEDSPSVSYITHEENEENKLPRSKYKLMLEDKEESVDEELSEEDNRLSIGKKLLTYMFHHLNDEKHYLHYFLQLLDYENKIKDKKEENFVILTLKESNDKAEKEKMKMTKKKGRKNSCNMSVDKEPTDYLILSPLTIMPATCSNESLMNRTAMRKVMLENFEELITDVNSYNAYLNELIDFEEGLVDN